MLLTLRIARIFLFSTLWVQLIVILASIVSVVIDELTYVDTQETFPREFLEYNESVCLGLAHKLMCIVG